MIKYLCRPKDGGSYQKGEANLHYRWEIWTEKARENNKIVGNNATLNINIKNAIL